MTPKKPIKRFIAWCDANLLLALAGVLLFVIPLLPKLPLFDILPGYIVRIRIEDFVILITIAFWFIQFVRGKISTHPLVSKLIAIYLLVGLASTLSAIFITRSVPMELLHVGKMYLHYFRRIEYFALFFIFFSAISSYSQAKKFIYLLVGVMIAVSVYGFGQKYLYWPVYSTMNREFSKGWRLYLTEHARVPSTFGGHYDAAAFTMVVITIILAVFLFAKNKWLKIYSGIAYLSGLWLLILTASRTSFIGYLTGVTLLMILVAFFRGIWYSISRWLLVMILSMAIMLTFGDLSERFSQLLGLSRYKEKYYAMLFTPKVDMPGNYVNLSSDDLVSSPSDQPPTPVNPPGNALPADVYEDIPDQRILVDDQGNATVIEVPRTYSDNAYKYGLSAAIRLDALWPRAIAGFMKNPLLGSGYSTLTKETVSQFTEAESTDNDFLRALGETGLLGFVSFFGLILVIMFLQIRSARHIKDPVLLAFTLGFVSGSIGLLINAFYIDVFEASKVASVYWALAGLGLAVVTLTGQLSPGPKAKVKNTQ